MGFMKVILLRHGQYSKGPSECLTTLGRKQALFAGKRLKNFRIDEMYVSTMPRARETARIVKSQLNFRKPMRFSSLIRECVPGYPKKGRAKLALTDIRRLGESKRKLNRAYKKLFGNMRAEKTILIVCHGNVIRYLVCKALGIPTLKWIKLDILQCAISVIEFRPKSKRVVLISHNDVGHIPFADQTFL